MKTKDFLNEHNACSDGAEWALSVSEDMADVWDAMIEHGRHEWLLWTATSPGVFPDSTLRKLACRFVRETPLADGRKVWDLLTDERSRKAVEVAERFADGEATKEERKSAYAAAEAAYAAAEAAYAAARAAAEAAYAADDSAYVASASARSAAYAAADAASASARSAACASAYVAARAAARAAYAAARASAEAAYAHAKAAQIKMIADLGNPFRKGQKDENERLFEEA